MDHDRLRFVFGDDLLAEVDLDDYDLEDENDRLELLDPTVAHLPPRVQIVRAIVANHILDGNPPEVWQTVQRLRAEHLDDDEIVDQLTLALEPTIHRSMMAGRSGEAVDTDLDGYLTALAALPLPDPDTIGLTIIDLVRSAPGVAIDGLATHVAARLGRAADDALVNAIDDQVEDLVDDDELQLLAGDRLVHTTTVAVGSVLTHRLHEAEQFVGTLNASFDLAAFVTGDHLHHDGREIEVFSAEPGQLGWRGGPGWLDGIAVGTVLAVRLDGATVSIDPLPDEPPIDPALVERVRAVYDEAVEEPGLPVSATELVFGLLVDDPDTFASPTAPLDELVAAAGLERRRDRVAHDDEIWHRDHRMGRVFRLGRWFDADSDVVERAMRVLDTADLVAGTDPRLVPLDEALDDDLLRSVLSDLDDDDILVAVVEALTAPVDTESREDNERFAAALIDVAGRGRALATAHLFASTMVERAAEPLRAEEHLRAAAKADPRSAFAIDRLAWYASDRGDAAEAVRLWNRIGPPVTAERDIEELRPFTTPTAPTMGRNEPCWCGSGRKYKQCHLGRVEPPSLPDRVGWLCRKAVAFLERRGITSTDEIMAVAVARADDPGSFASIGDALDDPIVMDLVLTELGWFERFLDERGELLPADERLLARSWTLVDRTVYEVTSVRRGEGVELRDLRTGDVLDVRERTFSREAKVGILICARAVPDGETHQLVGGIFPVKPGQEGAVLDLLDHGDALDIASWVRAIYQPPTLTTREGEPLVECEIRLEVDDADADAMRALLEERYERDDRPDADGDSWIEMHPLNDDERVLRASLHLDGDQLTVTTTSEQRAERVLDTILGAFPRTRVASDRRTPITSDRAAHAATIARAALDRGVGPLAAGAHDPDLAEALDELRDRMERRWCDESIPALGGRTPRECAADPTRREEVIRLIASFEGFDAGGDLGPSLTMRPARLRELLGL